MDGSGQIYLDHLAIGTERWADGSRSQAYQRCGRCRPAWPTWPSEPPDLSFGDLRTAKPAEHDPRLGLRVWYAAGAD